jgi:hypothetical protein
MSNDDTRDVTKADAPASQALQSRRQSLKVIGKFAAVTAPAMLILLDAGAAGACPDAGKKNGWDKNGKNSVV